MSTTDGGAITSHPGWGRRIGIALADIKIAHSVFALPFALLAGVLAVDAASIASGTVAVLLALIVVCMVLARTWAMLVNRLADHAFDRANPRTARRMIASDRLSVRDGWIIALGCAALFVLVCTGFWFAAGNPWPVILCVPVLAWIALYSYTKRFTALCHLFLGGALAASPLAAVIAVDPAVLFSTTGFAVLHIAGFVLFWVAGFDVAYALQDLEFDRETGLHSIPARLGWKRAMWVSRAMHVFAFAAIAGAWWWAPPFGALMGTACVAVAGLLIWEHLVIRRRGIEGIPMAFFTINGIVSVVLGGVGVLDVVV